MKQLAVPLMLLGVVALACASDPGAGSPLPQQTSGAAGSATASGGAGMAGSNLAGMSPVSMGGGVPGGGAGAAGAAAGISGAGGAAGQGGSAGSAGAGGQGACPTPAVLCDGFEAGNLEQFEVLETGGKLGLDATHVYSGESSVLLTIPANQRGGFLEAAGAPLFPLKDNTVWGRMMVYFEDLPGGHFDTVRGAPTGGGTPWFNIGGQTKALLLNYYSGPLDCYAAIQGKPALPLKKWVCWEFQYDGVKNSMTLWVDGQLSKSITGQGDGCVGGKQGTWDAPEFGSVRLGQFNAQTAGNQTRMWLDDVALGSEGRIGCPSVSATAH